MDRSAAKQKPARTRAGDSGRSASAPTIPGKLASLWDTFAFRSGLLVMLLLIASGLTFDPKLYINGDNVDYILLAQRLIREGVIWGSRKFPPFFPILLTPVQLLFGAAWIPQKLLVFALYLGCGPLLLRISERVLPRTAAFGATLLGLTLIPVVEFSHYVMSEIPFLFISLAALVAGERLLAPDLAKGPLPRRNLALFGIWSGLAFYTRSMGATLLAGLAMTALAMRRLRLALITLAISAIVLVPWVVHTAFSRIEGASYLDQVLYVNPYYPETGKLNAARLAQRLELNANQYLLIEIPGALIPATYLSTYTIGVQAEDVALPPVAAIAIMGLVILGGIFAARRASLLVGYVAASLLIALLWPPIWASIRFVLPILPLLVLLMFVGLGGVIDWLGAVRKSRVRGRPASSARPIVFAIAMGMLLALAARNLVRYEAETDKYPAPWAAYFEAAEWAKHNLPPGSMVLDRKPNIFGLVSGLPGCSFPRETDPEKMLSYLREKKIRYVHASTIPYDDLTRILYPFLAKRSNYFQIVWAGDPSGSRGVILEFHPEDGCSGFQLSW